MAEHCPPPTTRAAPQPGNTMRSLSVAFARAAVLAIGLLLLTRDVTGPFIGHHEDTSAGYSIFARNHIEYGLGYTKLYCTWGDTKTPPAVPNRYLTHPPLIAVWAALPMLVLGDHEWVARSVPIAATLGSVWLLMVMLSRLHGSALGVLAGLFYVMLPATGYFGRMLDHVPVAQFFNLLMLHGYLQWSGWYGDNCRRGTGAIEYAVGAVLGIGTAWNTVILAGLIWIWHVARTRFRRGSRGMLLALTLVPAAALAAVVLHILAGCGWNGDLFGPLLWSRTLGGGQAWLAWLGQLWAHLLANVSAAGVVAAMLYLGLVLLARRRTDSTRGAWRSIADRRVSTPMVLTLLHGLLYVVLFKNQSFHHDYWQYPALPFFAAALASVVLASHAGLATSSVWAARAVAVVLLLAPLPLFARGRNRLYEETQRLRELTETLARISALVPARVPVTTSLVVGKGAATFGSYTRRWTNPVAVYYAHRPLIHTIHLEEIVTNRTRCPAYLLYAADRPALQLLARQLAANYESVPVGPEQVLFLLDRPK